MLINLHDRMACNVQMREWAGEKFRTAQNEEGFTVIPLSRKKGEIYLHGRVTVAAYFKYAPTAITFNMIKAKCPDASMLQRGDQEMTISHPVNAKLHDFFRACKARTRRRLTDEERLAATERLAKVRLPSKRHVQDSAKMAKKSTIPP